MEYTKNTDPHYFETNQDASNCGSFAFNIEEWYAPEEDFLDSVGYMTDWIIDMLDNDYSIDELADIYTEALVTRILSDFGSDIRPVDLYDEIDSDEELVALRGWCYFDDDDWAEWDFHFKVLRDGLWQEKCGSGPVRFCLEDEWSYGFRTYNSETFYFAHRV